MSRTTSFSRYSLHKQTVLNNVMRYLAVRHRSCVAAGSRVDEFLFVDAHGGLGMWRNSKGERCLGSPVVTYRTLEKEGIPYRGFVFEKNHTRFDTLQSHLSFAQYEVECFELDNCNAPRILADRYEGDASYVISEPNPDDDSAIRELGGMIYYDCDGHGSASEIEQLTRDNRLDILIHCCAAKRSRYRHCSANPEYPTSVGDETTVELSELRAQVPAENNFTHNVDHDVIHHIASYNRPYWYIGEVDRRDIHNKFQFQFLFGTHVPLEMFDGYSTCIPSENSAGESYEFLLDETLCPLYTPEGIRRQHTAFYSKEDMAHYDAGSNSIDDRYMPVNFLPFQVVTGEIPEGNTDVQEVGEGTLHANEVPTTSDVNPFLGDSAQEDTIF